MKAWGSERDFVGYGGTPPHPRWPGGARIALNIVINYEEGSELSFADGDGVTETGLTEGGGGFAGRDLAAESMYEFGARVGFWRVLRILSERNAPATIFGCALALERNAAACAAIRETGFDVCSHGWRWIRHQELSLEQEREHIRRAVEFDHSDDRRASARLVLPLWPEREHATARRRGRRVPLRFGRLQRRASLLARHRRPPAPRRALQPRDQRRKIRPWRRPDRR